MQPKAREVMSKNLVTIKYYENLESAYKKLTMHQIRHLPVIDELGDVIGIISDRDVQRGMQPESRDYMSFESAHADFDPALKVADYMSIPIKTVGYNESLQVVAQRMVDEKVSSFLVSKDDMIIGIITHEDLLEVLVKLLAPKEESSLFKGAREWFYKTSVGEVASRLA